ncbi:j domain-containing protein [Lasius niger]|uniref:J domain-containing protein n=1 Tax=Lasius niger TaxID=67767 RepID=A0A0J7L470_LASNI|nr:j domain-containing protein [Lasius niger]
MTTETPKVEFALGSEVSPGRFFKSAFARNFISSGRDCKSLDYELLDNAIVDDHQREDRNNNARNNNFFSLVNFADDKPVINGGDDALWEQPKPKNEVNVCTVLQCFLSHNVLLTSP